eukprot:14220297-Alexandrium_andersonii.AAC.1
MQREPPSFSRGERPAVPCEARSPGAPLSSKWLAATSDIRQTNAVRRSWMMAERTNSRPARAQASTAG